jgi:SAM-dependent methyltransferase
VPDADPDADAHTSERDEAGVAHATGGAAIDAGALMADIEREVRQRRRAGQIDEDYERELDRLFDAVAPPGATGPGLEAALTRAERAAIIDPVGPVASRLPGVALVRRVLRKLLAFYVEHVVRQVTAFGVMVVRAIRVLGDRVDEIEARSPVTDPRLAAVGVPVTSDLDLAPWHDLAVKACSPATARVVHAECGDGALVVALRDAGVDAYGVDPRRDAAAVADEHGAEVRSVAVLDHLRAVPPAALGGAVLSGCTERYAAGDLVELVDLARRVLAPGAPLVLVSRGPSAPAADPIASDLAPGRPFHAQTWAFLLDRAGFGEIEVHADGATPLTDVYAVTARRTLAP